MTGAREAGVLHGQARMREARKASHADRETLALERIAEALEGLEVSFAAIADIVEAQAYGDLTDEELDG